MKALYLMLVIGFFLLISCKHKLRLVDADSTKEKQDLLTKEEKEDLLQKAAENCFNLMLNYDSLQPYYHLCLDELDSCKPKIYISGMSISRITFHKDYYAPWIYERSDKYPYETYLRDIPVEIEFVFGSDIFNKWIDYWIYFHELDLKSDYVFFEFEMLVVDGSSYRRGGMVDDPLRPLLHPRRRYPEVRVKMEFEKEKNLWKVTNFNLFQLPPYDSKLLKLGRSVIERENSKRFCIKQPFEVDMKDELIKMNWPLDSFWLGVDDLEPRVNIDK